MKFARDLAAASSGAPDVFRGSFLNYAGLKKFLKFRSRQLKQIQGQTASFEASRKSEAEFLRMLAGQLKEVDRRFETEARAVISAFDATKSKRKSFRLHRDPRESAMDPQVALDLADRAKYCLQYAQTNAQALRKIAKKQDKVRLPLARLQLQPRTRAALVVLTDRDAEPYGMQIFGNKTGQQFVQACWRGDIAVKSFLSAPMLSELAAVEELLRSKAAAATTDPGHFSGGATSSECPSDSGGGDPDDAFKCAICLDVMYQPVALECGHKFCARCAIAIAVGHEGSQGSVEHLLASGPVGCSSVPCPQCRATEHGLSGRGVFFDARRLPHLDQLIQSRYSRDWQRRKDEDEAEQKELRAARAPSGLMRFLSRRLAQPGGNSSPAQQHH